MGFSKTPLVIGLLRLQQLACDDDAADARSHDAEVDTLHDIVAVYSATYGVYAVS